MGSTKAVCVAASILCGMAFALAAQAQDDGKGEDKDKDKPKAERPLFLGDAPLALTIQAPWDTILRKPTDTRRHPAVFEAAGQGPAQRLEGTVETRGLTRRRICSFPPLRLRFTDGTTKGTVFAGQDDLKMVTHCQVGQDFAQYYVQEFVAYRIYNLVTPQSFRVRALEASYRDAGDGKVQGPRFAFLIEDLGDVAKRLDLKRDPRPKLLPKDYDPVATSRFALFQFLIGNTDWDLTTGPRSDECCHNARALGAGEALLVPVPYDFDSAGIVSAEYAAPDPSLPIKEVRERVFRGFCVHNATLPAARAEFLAKREAIFQLARDEPRLNTPRRRALVGYLESFYAILDSDEKFAKQVTAKCRK
jgi:hypothetical protein